MQSWYFLVVSLSFSDEFQRVNDLRQLPEKRMACALQIAKQADYSPKEATFMTFSPARSRFSRALLATKWGSNRHSKAWIPAFAGMTSMDWGPLNWGQIPINFWPANF
jgi:hypothetical protein